MASLNYAAWSKVAKRYPAQPASVGMIRALYRFSAALFLLSAVVGLWTAYDRQVALVRFGWIAAGVLFAVLAPRIRSASRTRALYQLGLLCAWTAAGLGGLHLLSNLGGDGAQTPVGIGLPHENAVAGALIVLLSLGLGSVLYLWRRDRHVASMATFGLLAVGLVALILTGSRGAMAGLAAGAVIALYAAWRTMVQPSPHVRVADTALAAILVGSLVIYAAMVVSPAFAQRLGIAEWGGSPASRIKLWRDTFPLIQDYVFTGSGLGGTAMVYSSYVFLLHVPYFYHAHNLYLQIAVEQGLLGVVGFAGMAVAGVWALWICQTRLYGTARVFATTTMAALVALLVHGLFDAEVFVSPLVVVLFAPFGFAGIRLGRTWHMESPDSRLDVRPDGALRVYWAGGLVLLLVAAVIVSWPRARATLEANLGAVLQTRAELSVYQWPEWPIQDEVRRTYPDRLGPALAWYERALRTDPTNATANRRLGQIELSLGEYAAALAYLEAAYELAPNQRATRQMLGEAYAVTGQTDNAGELWQTVDTEAGQLDLRRWWYDYVGANSEAMSVMRAISMIHTGRQD